jgi:hypothetical protein
MFKSGAVRVKKCHSSTSSNTNDKPIITAREAQTSTIASVSRSKPSAHAITDTSTHKRFLDDWLATTLAAIDILIQVRGTLVPRLVHDLEVVQGMKIMRRIATRVRETMAPFDKLAEPGAENEVPTTVTHGKYVAETLRDVLFPDLRQQKGEGLAQGWNTSYEALHVMQGLHTYVLHVTGLVDALTPVAQALWDKELIAAVGFAKDELGRMQAWAKQQIVVRSPQTLIVPSTAQ